MTLGRTLTLPRGSLHHCTRQESLRDFPLFFYIYSNKFGRYKKTRATKKGSSCLVNGAERQGLTLGRTLTLPRGSLHHCTRQESLRDFPLFFYIYSNKFGRYKKTRATKKGSSCLVNCAERQGFEPWVQLPVQRFSRPSRSTTPASFLLSNCGCKCSEMI